MSALGGGRLPVTTVTIRAADWTKVPKFYSKFSLIQTQKGQLTASNLVTRSPESEPFHTCAAVLVQEHPSLSLCADWLRAARHHTVMDKSEKPSNSFYR